MKVKTSELTGPALDWAVAACLGYTVFNNGQPPKQFVDADGRLADYCDTWAPSASWAQGGPIKTAARIGTLPNRDGNGWEAGTAWEFFESESFAYHRSNGETELIAAMRCFVASKLGDEVDVPEELL